MDEDRPTVLEMISILRSNLGLSNNDNRANDRFILKDRGDGLKYSCKLNKKGVEIRGHSLSPQG